PTLKTLCLLSLANLRVKIDNLPSNLREDLELLNRTNRDTQRPTDEKKRISSSSCPCENQTLCQPLQIGDRKEKIAFQVDKSNWLQYDWSQLTTIALFTELDPQLLCYAHARNVRLVWAANFPVDQLLNDTANDIWINEQVEKVRSTYTDGVNVDMEDSILDKTPQVKLFTELVRNLTNRMHETIPGSQVTVDVAWSPSCIDLRCYDYVGLSQASDWLFVMSYDMRSQIFDTNDCIASANSPIHLVSNGLFNFTRLLDIPVNKLVLGVPWYCYDYRCLSLDDKNICQIEHVPFRGAPCSDAGGREKDYSECRRLLRTKSTTGRLWNDTYKSAYFNYMDTDFNFHQIWMDDPESLGYKYQIANSLELRGVGMWNVDALDYSNSTEEGIQDTKNMWNAMKQFHT
ncbi:unnamed protein product, partial [Didymodactylos carnosus]